MNIAPDAKNERIDIPSELTDAQSKSSDRAQSSDAAKSAGSALPTDSAPTPATPKTPVASAQMSFPEMVEAVADSIPNRQAETSDGVLNFTCQLIRPIFQKGDFSIWMVRIVSDPLVTPDGEEMDYIVIKGDYIKSLIQGGQLEVSGTWDVRRYNGETEYQIKVFAASPKLPQSLEGMIAFLESAYIKGCGPATARKIVDHFGEDTWNVLDHFPDRLAEIKGLGRKQRQKITSSYAENVGFRDIITDLAPYGIGPHLAVRIAQKMPNIRTVIKEDPFSLCDEKIGVGFKTADRIAAANGLDETSPARFAAGLNFIMQQAEPSGDCYLNEAELLDQAWALLRTDKMGEAEAMLPAHVLAELVRSGLYIREELGENEAVRIYRRPVWYMEKDVADLLITLLHAADDGRPEQMKRKDGHGGAADAAARNHNNQAAHQDRELIEKLVDEAAVRLGFVPAQQQREAAIRFFTEPLMILTGIPGSGKTSTLKLILESLGQDPEEILLCAPTGRAARRMAEQTGRDASTIHSAIQLDPESEDMPEDYLEFKTIIIDEASMIDLRLMHNLLQRIAPGTRLLITGDPYQLPSVGAGNVLNDLITSDIVPVVRLNKLFRQLEGSEIAENAKAIREGSTNLIYNETSAFQTAKNLEDAAELIHRLYLKAIEFVGSEEEVICLTPLRQRTSTGSNALNKRLKESLNPVPEGANSIQYGDREFHSGDRVMLTRNSKLPLYDDEDAQGQVSNGDTGRILSITSDSDGDKSAVVEFNNERYLLDQQHFQYMDWAYACTVHKSQGSEYKFVILCLMNAHHIMLKRNLIYTAFTRAKQNIIIVGQKSAVNRAITTEDAIRRKTGLERRIQEAEFNFRQGKDWSLPSIISDIEL